MKRIMTSLMVFLVVFIIFALIISPLRRETIQLTILFFPTITASVEAVAYVSFFIGLFLATWIAFVGDLALRRRFRATRAEYEKQLKTASDTKDGTANSSTASPGEQKLEK